MEEYKIMFETKEIFIHFDGWLLASNVAVRKLIIKPLNGCLFFFFFFLKGGGERERRIDLVSPRARVLTLDLL